MAESPRPWGSWLERRRRLMFGWLLLLVFIIQNLGVWIAWRAGSPLQTALGLLGGGCTLYLLLSNHKRAISMTTAYRVGAAFLTLRVAVELISNALTGHAMTTVQYLETTILIAFLVTILPIRISAAVTSAILTGILALTLRESLRQLVEFMVLFLNAVILHFTSEYGRQTYQAKRRIEELERQLVWDPLTGVASHQLIEEKIRTFMLTANNDTHLAVTITVQDPRTTSTVEGRSALQHTVKAIRPLLREEDSLGRWNTDTLLLLFPHVTAAQRYTLLSMLSSALHDLKAQGVVPQAQLGHAMLHEAATPEALVNLAQQQPADA